MQESVFDKVVVFENAYTQLLCNLMERNPELKEKLLELLFSQEAAQLALKFPLQTQVTLTESHGRPDIYLSTPDLDVVVEVKTSLGTPASGLQSWELEEDATLRGYRQFLLSKKTSHRWFTYLVPNGWFGIEKLHKLQKQHHLKDGICLKVVTWEKLFSRIDDSLRLDPFVEEFQLLLSKRFEPISLSPHEVTMLLDPAAFRAAWKLTKLIRSISEKAKSAGFPVELERDFKSSSEAFYLMRGKEYLLYFGSWLEYAEKQQSLLCFGVSDGWSPEVVQRFSSNSPFPVVDFRDPKKWLMNSIPEDLLTSEDSATEIWILIKPLFECLRDGESPSVSS